MSPPAVRGARRRSPSPASHDPAPRASVCRAVALAADAWRTAALANPARFAATKGAEKLARDGEAALAALANEAARCVGERTASRNGTRRETCRRTNRVAERDATRRAPGTSAGRAIGAVVAEAARAAATVWSALVASRARPADVDAAQAHFARPELVDDPTADDWPARLFAQRALADVFFHRGASDVGRERASDLAPAMALWATSAGADAVSGGVGPLAAALFSRPSLRVLGEGAAAGAGAESVARLQSRCAERGDDATSTIAFAPAGSNASRDAAFDAAPGEALTRVEAEFRASAGALVGAQLASADVDGADALARVAAAFPRLAREYDAFLLDVDAAATTTDAASTTTAAAEFARVTDARRRRRRGNRALARRVHREGADAPPGGDRTGRARRARAPRARARVRVGCATRREMT